jgi:hypothetical protein
MKQPRSWWRLLVVGLLLVLAWQVHVRWPTLSWRIPLAEDLLGFDTAKQLFYTVNRGKEHILNSFDLATGQFVTSVTLKPVITNEMSNRTLSIAPDALVTLNPEEWYWLLSPNKREIIGLYAEQDIRIRLDASTGKQLQRYTNKTETNHERTEAYAFNHDGTILARLIRGLKVMQLLDLQEAHVLKQKELPELPTSFGGFGRFSPKRLHLSMNDTLSYVAVNSASKTYIMDLKSELEEVLHPHSCYPQFLAGGQLLVLMPEPSVGRLNPQPIWFRMNNQGKWLQEKTVLEYPESCGSFVGFTSEFLVTRQVTIKDMQRPDWLPYEWWVKLVTHLRLTGFTNKLHYWELRTGRLAKVTEYFEPALVNNLISGTFVPIEYDLLSEDGEWLAYSFNSDLVVRNTAGRRSLWYWFTLSAVLLVALWNFRRCFIPRPARVKPIASK